MYTDLELIGTRPVISRVMQISEQNLIEVSKHEIVHQSIGIEEFELKILEGSSVPQLPNFWNLFVANKGVSVRKNLTKNPQQDFTSEFCERYQNKSILPKIHAQVIIEGPRVYVSNRMDELAGELYQRLQIYKSNKKNNAAQESSPFKYNFVQTLTTPVTLNEIKIFDQQMASRLELVVLTRPISQLTEALAHKDRLIHGLAMMNVLLNDFHISPKGGVIRDAIARGLSTYNDLDLNAPSTLTPQEVPNFKNNLITHFQQQYHHQVYFVQSRVASQVPGNPPDGILVFKDKHNLELEIVTPWNTPFFSPTVQDMSVNNFILVPDFLGLKQVFFNFIFIFFIYI
jgi:hypothetical protein